MTKFIVLMGICMLATGCAYNPKEEQNPALASSKVKENAELALAQCGKGNVDKVTSSGFACKK